MATTRRILSRVVWAETEYTKSPTNLIARKRPRNFARPKPLDDFTVSGYEIRLFVPEKVGISEPEPRSAALAVIGRRRHLVAESELRNEHGKIFARRPVEHARHVRECEGRRSAARPGSRNRQVDVQPRVGIHVDEKPLLLARGIVEHHVFAVGGRDGALGLELAADRLGEARPLAEVARGVEIGHARRARGVGAALPVADYEISVLLVEIRHEEELEKAAENIHVLGHFVLRYPAVAHRLQNHGYAVHLPVRADIAPVRPPEPVGAHDVRKYPQILFGEGAQARDFPVAQVHVGVQLQRLADENERHYPVDVEHAVDSERRLVVKILSARGLLNAFEKFVYELAGFVLFAQPHAEPRDGFGYVENLQMVFVVAAREKPFVEIFARLLRKLFPYEVPVFRRAERKQAERRVREAVLGVLFIVRLGGYAGGGEVDNIVAVYFRKTRGPVELPERHRGVPGSQSKEDSFSTGTIDPSGFMAPMFLPKIDWAISIHCAEKLSI